MNVRDPCTLCPPLCYFVLHYLSLNSPDRSSDPPPSAYLFSLTVKTNRAKVGWLAPRDVLTAHFQNAPSSCSPLPLAFLRSASSSTTVFVHSEQEGIVDHCFLPCPLFFTAAALKITRARYSADKRSDTSAFWRHCYFYKSPPMLRVPSLTHHLYSFIWQRDSFRTVSKEKSIILWHFYARCCPCCRIVLTNCCSWRRKRRRRRTWDIDASSNIGRDCLRTMAFKFVKLREKKDEFWMKLAVGCWHLSAFMKKEQPLWIDGNHLHWILIIIAYVFHVLLFPPFHHQSLWIPVFASL